MAGWLALMAAVAVTPSIPGILKSISTMSGWRRAASATACAPSPCLGDDLQIRLALDHAPEPGPYHGMIVAD